MLKNKECYWGK